MADKKDADDAAPDEAEVVWEGDCLERNDIRIATVRLKAVNARLLQEKKDAEKRK
jgi:hypothetical protein